MSRPKLLIVEDDEAIRTQLKYALRDDFTLLFAGDGAEALAVFREAAPPLVSLDLGLPPAPDGAEEGLRVLDEMLKLAPATKVIVLTGNSDRENAIRAVQLGALDYHAKPLELDAFKVVLARAAFLHGLEAESEKHLRSAETATRFEEIIGNTPAMKDIFAVVARVAKTDATVLIQGESGTGKELLARAIHAGSPRRTRPFVAINCGAIPETLLEAELFGHEKGAYTGAHIQRKGKLEVAESGTLFLDEIAEMSGALQVKLLRFLQERRVERIGGRESIPVDVRVIAATNKDLKSELQAGHFREDLYYRLSVVNLRLPPLRERAEDIVLIANALLRRACKPRRRKLRLSNGALEALARYPWPGNIRELENTIQRAVIMAQGRLIEPGDLGIEMTPGPSQVPSLRAARGRAEREAVVDALIKSRGNISQAAKHLGVSRPTFHALLDKFQVNAREFK
jgi:two-component system, NtrC family, response regulator